MRRTTILLSAGALALGLGVGACGDDDGGGSSTGDGVPTQTTTTANPVTEQIAKLRECLGGKPVTRVDVFEPTYDFAKANGGGGFAVKLDKQQIELLVLPDAAAATTASEDASNQLIALQQTNPEGYAAVAATAMQTFGNVVEIVPTGATSPEVNTKIATCATDSAA
jgi:hypothetical protein